MMRLLFLCLLLLLPASAAALREFRNSSELEGSADDSDDEDYVEREASNNLNLNAGPGKTTGVEGNSDEGYMIIIVIAGVVLALSVAAVVTILIVKRKMQQQEQGIYSVPIEQDHKGSV